MDKSNLTETNKFNETAKSKDDFKSINESSATASKFNNFKVKEKLNKNKINMIKENILKNMYQNHEAKIKRNNILKLNLKYLDEKDKHALQNCSRKD